MTALYQHDLFLQHETGSHPESPGRLRAINLQLQKPELSGKTRVGKVTAATPEQIDLVHNPDYRQHLEEFARTGGGRIETDTVMSPQSYQVALLAAGTALQAVEQVMNGTDRSALCLVRPPGHHALPEHAMGFCLFNNIALAARYAIKKQQLARVLIVDWDVHHGNGTQHIFYEEEQVTFFSSHRSPFYPGTGQATETGTGAGLGTTFNLPVTYGTTRAEFLRAFETELHRAAEKCRPELILLSAGFDAHRLDPVGSLDLETEDFATLTNMVCQVARSWCQGRLVSLLEGGYHPQALADSVTLHLETLLANETG